MHESNILPPDLHTANMTESCLPLCHAQLNADMQELMAALIFMVMQLLQDHHLAEATDLLITGDSAGGVAAFNNAGFMADMLRCAPSACPARCAK